MTLENVADMDAEETLFSADYFTDILKGIQDAKTERVEIQYAEDFPLYLDTTREINGGEMDVRYMLAPRIKTE